MASLRQSNRLQRQHCCENSKPDAWHMHAIPGTVTQCRVWSMAQINRLLARKQVVGQPNDSGQQMRSNESLASLAEAQPAGEHGKPKVNSISCAVTMRFLFSDLRKAKQDFLHAIAQSQTYNQSSTR